MAMDLAGNFSEAVLFLSDKGVSKEMLFSEFESVLDEVVGLTDCKNKEMKAVFVQITPQHKVTSTVFFLIKFNDEGMADKGWNLPLRHLADSHQFHGPDLGAGPVRLACSSQCSDQWLENQLWDPSITDECNHFAFIRDTIKRNRLGLLYAEPVIDQTLPNKGNETLSSNVSTIISEIQKSKSASISSDLVKKLKAAFEKDFQQKIEQVENKQKLYLATMENRHKREFDKLYGDHQTDTQTYKNQIAQLKKLVEQERKKYEKTLSTFQEQYEKLQQQRVQLEESLSVSVKDKHALETLKKQYESDMQARLEAEQASLFEQLEMREVELLYRQQQEEQLNKMVEQLRQDKITLLGEGADRYLERLNKSGIMFVAYQAGFGHLTIPLNQMGEYIDDPLVYVAGKNGLTIDQYKTWLTHYNNPLCVAKLFDGSRCTVALKQIASPKEFMDGEHNYCLVHRAQLTKTSV